MDSSIARRMWAALEPIHAMIYFTPEALEAWNGIGFTHPRMGYFASRSAAMGPVDAAVVSSVFYNFNPRTVERFIPDAWSIAPPDEVVRTRYDAADRALRRLLGEAVTSPEMEKAADTAIAAIQACRPEGRPLFAGHAAVSLPDEPHLRLWHAATLYREYRGDGHAHALMAAGVSGLEAVVSYTATGELFDRDFFIRSRGWSEEDWSAGEETLRRKGWLDGDGSLTEIGHQGRDRIESETNRMAMDPWNEIGEAAADELATTIRPWARAVLDADILGGGGRNVRVYQEAN